MFTHYIKLALRFFRDSLAVYLIKLSSLVFGIFFTILIGLYIFDQLQYDEFYRGSERVYRIAAQLHMGDRNLHAPLTSGPVGKTLESNYSYVETSTRLHEQTRKIKRRGRTFNEENFFYTDSTFFDIFPFDLRYGAREEALTQPYTIVLTHDMAEKYFGTDNPIGRSLNVQGREYTVTGVLSPVLDNTHLEFDFLASMQSINPKWMSSWIVNNFYTYIKLSSNTGVENLQSGLPDFVRTHIGSRFAESIGTTFQKFLSSGGEYNLYLQPVESIHLTSDLEYEMSQNGRLMYVYIMGLIGLLVILIASVNYVNLTIAFAHERSKEVGIRKSLGAKQFQIWSQICGESVLLSGVGLIISLGLVKASIGSVNNFFGLSIEVNVFSNLILLLTLVVGAVLLGLVSGAYPAWHLTQLEPINTLRGRFGRMGSAKMSARNVLVIFQFAVSIALIVGVLGVFKQVRHLLNQDIGMSTERIVVVNRTDELGSQWRAFRDELEEQPGIRSVAGASTVPGEKVREVYFRPPSESGKDNRVAWFVQATPMFFETASVNLIEGRTFAEGARQMGLNGVWINETAARSLRLDNPVGKELIISEEPTRVRIVGVFKDVNFKSFKRKMRPTIIRAPDSPPQYFYVKYDNRADKIVDSIEQEWSKFTTLSFEYSLLDRKIEKLYSNEERTAIVGVYSTLFAIIIACLGIFGLSVHAVEHQKTEIAVRKTFGASSPSIAGRILRQFLGRVGIAYVLAAPVAWYALQRWLQRFPNRINIDWKIFAGAALLSLLITGLVVSISSFRAARTDPAETLRDE